MNRHNSAIFCAISIGLVANWSVGPEQVISDTEEQKMEKNFCRHYGKHYANFVTWPFIVRFRSDLLQIDQWDLNNLFPTQRNKKWEKHSCRNYGQNWATFCNLAIYRPISTELVAEWLVMNIIIFPTLYIRQFFSDTTVGIGLMLQVGHLSSDFDRNCWKMTGVNYNNFSDRMERNIFSDRIVGIGLLFVIWLFMGQLRPDLLQNDRWYMCTFFRHNRTKYFFPRGYRIFSMYRVLPAIWFSFGD